MSVLLELPTRIAPPARRAPAPQGAILLRLLDVLDRAQIPCCLLHGYNNYPHTIDGDVDCLIPAEFLPRKLAQVLHDNRGEIGAQVVQWFQDGAHFIVLAGRDESGSPVLLQLHVSPHYEMGGRVFFDARQILNSWQQYNGFSVPAADVEFMCILANKLCKGTLNDDHGRRLSSLFIDDPTACAKQARRFLQPSAAALVIEAAVSWDWKSVRESMRLLRSQLLHSRATRPAGRRIPRLLGKIRRHLRPRNGFHAVFLGPDGVGKSTTIEAFQRGLAPAFLSNTYLTFAPGLLPQKFAPPKPDGPHSLPPRSLPASLLKAAWWLICYTLGYCAAVRPNLARGGLVVNHRYLVDAIVDRKRYRYRGPVWLLKWIWAVVPRPDVLFLLDAAPEIIYRRKQEVPFEEIARQVEAYRAVIGTLPIGRIIDASRPPAQVADDVQWLALDQMAQRIVRRFSLDAARSCR
jgi:thymidylate kinase